MAFLLDVEFCRSASFGEGWWFLRAVMDLLEGKAGSGGTCLGTRGADRLTCLCWTGMSRDLNIFLREIWERSSQLIQLLERAKRRDWRKGTCMALLLPSFSGEWRKKFYFQCKKKKSKSQNSSEMQSFLWLDSATACLSEPKRSIKED